MAQNYKAFYTDWLDWIANAVLDANVDYPGLDCRGASAVYLEFIMASDSAPAGTLFIEWSMDNVTYYPFAIDAGKFSVLDPGSKLTVTEATGQCVVAALAAESRLALGIEKPPAFLRWRWASGAGGIATGASAKSYVLLTSKT